MTQKAKKERQFLILDNTVGEEHLVPLSKLYLNTEKPPKYNLVPITPDTIPESGTHIFLLKDNSFYDAELLRYKCHRCDDRLTMHDDESGDICRWCVTGWKVVDESEDRL